MYLILNRKIKYKGKTYPLNEKGVTDPVPVNAKDVKFFEDNGMVVNVIDDKGNKAYVDKRDKEIETLKAEIEELKAELAQKDKLITTLEHQVEELKNTAPEVNMDSVDVTELESEVETDDLEEKSIEELYDLACGLDISGRSKLRNDKKALIKAIREAQAKGD